MAGVAMGVGMKGRERWGWEFRSRIHSVYLATLRDPSACNVEATAGSRELGRNGGGEGS